MKVKCKTKGKKIRNHFITLGRKSLASSRHKTKSLEKWTDLTTEKLYIKRIISYRFFFLSALTKG
jgi:hypothetical protein